MLCLESGPIIVKKDAIKLIYHWVTFSISEKKEVIVFYFFFFFDIFSNMILGDSDERTNIFFFKYKLLCTL